MLETSPSTFTWSHDPAVQEYTLMVRRVGRPWQRWTLASSQVCTNGICVVEMTQLTDGLVFRPGRTYAWRVRADGSVSSPVVRFRVPERDLSETDERSTPSPWGMRIISDSTNSRQWSTVENNAIVSARVAVATMFKRFTQWPEDSNAEAFNRVMVNGDLVQRILLVRANIPDVNGAAPAISVTDPVTGAIYYNVVRNGNCAASDGTGSLWPLPPTQPAPKMIICNGTFTVSAYTMVHEFGHLFDYASDVYLSTTNPMSLSEKIDLTDTPGLQIYGCTGTDVVMGLFTNGWTRGLRGWGSGPAFQPNNIPLITTFQQNPIDKITEEAAADMFLNYVYRSNQVASQPGDQTNGRGAVACANPVAWNGPAFLNKSWIDPVTLLPVTSYEATEGFDDTRLPGNRRHSRTHKWIGDIFAEHPNW